MRLSLIYLFLIFSIALSGQITVEGEYNAPETNLFLKKDSTDYPLPYLSKNPFSKEKVKFRLEAGTTFGTTFGHGNYFGTYLAPQMQYRLTEKFSFRTGGLFTISPVNSYMESGRPGSQNLYFGNNPQSFVFVEGAYQLNQNITLTGTLVKEVNMYRDPFQNKHGGNQEYQGMILGMDYKVGENSFIRGQIEFSRGGHSRSYNPFFQPGFNTNPDPYNGYTPQW